MDKVRLLAFSDGVIAIIITIMVLELKPPHDPTFAGLTELLPDFLSYILSFIYVGIYWNNHHHMMHMLTSINGQILWANTHLLFWLSLIPFTTAWMGENHFAPAPTTLYGVALLMAAIGYSILQKTIIRAQGKGSTLAKAIGRDLKGNASPLLYGVAILISFTHPLTSNVIYAGVALMWLMPDRRIERSFKK